MMIIIIIVIIITTTTATTTRLIIIAVTLVKQCGFKCGWCGFNPDYPHWNYTDKVGNVVRIWFMWIY